MRPVRAETARISAPVLLGPPRFPRERGIALVEFALVLPLLLALVLGVVDLSRAIQFNNVLVHLTREGANLAARTTESPDRILRTLMSTATPLTMNTDGMMYITKLVGEADGRARVEDQFRPATGGNAALASRLWACPGAFPGGRCTMPATRPVLSLAVPLLEGETVYAVESLYDYTLLTRYVIASDPGLYSLTIL